MPEFHRNDDQLTGLLLIGDPHLEARQPGFRKDDFAETILGKLQWCLNHAREQQLLPVFLGDLFDKPRGNPNWLVNRLIKLLSATPSVGIYGNHDCADPMINAHDSLSLLIAAGCYRLVSETDPYRFRVADREVILGGSSYRQPIPDRYALPRRRQGLFDADPLVVWITHHDIGFPGYDAGFTKPHPIQNVSLLVNGHIHRQLESVVAGNTRWINPGNISRRSRSEAVREHVPHVLRIDVTHDDHAVSRIEVPHAPFDEVFHEVVVEEAPESSTSNFVTGLAELTARRTDSGAGLHQFLKSNLASWEPQVADIILQLAQDVTESRESEHE